MSTKGKPNRPIKSLNTAFDIIDHIKELDGVGVSELARKLDMSPGTVHSHLKTLEHLELVVNEDNKYRLGFKLLDYGMFARDQYSIVDSVRPSLELIAEETGLVAWYVTIEHNWGIHLDVSPRNSAYRIRGRPGHRFRPHTTPSGKAILSQLSNEEVDEIIEYHGFVQKTNNTVTSRAELFRDLEEISELGYAYTQSESVEGLCGVAVPIAFDEVYGSISVSGPSSEFSDEKIDEILAVLRTQQNNIQLRLLKNH